MQEILGLDELGEDGPPDRDWLGFTQKMSTGAFAGSTEFDPNAEFMPKYATRRTELEKHIAASDSLRVGN